MKRRMMIGGSVAALAVVAAGGALRLFAPHRAPTPYDDLLNQIVDRTPAAALGKAAAKTMPGFNVKAVAARLRRPGFALASRAPADAAAGRVVEVGGWIVPQSVALYGALAAQFA